MQKKMELDNEEVKTNDEKLSRLEDQNVEEPVSGDIGQKRNPREPLERDFKRMKRLSDVCEPNEKNFKKFT